MSKLKTLGLFAAAILLFSTCSKDDEPDTEGPVGNDDSISTDSSQLALNVRALFEGEVFNFQEQYLNYQNYRFSVVRLRFYMSNIVAVSSDGTEHQLSHIEFIDIPGEENILNYTVESGEYSGIRFDLGVPVSMNGTDNPDFSTAIYSAESPLSINNGMYWTWANGYRFFTFEGRFDTVPDPQEILPLTFGLHTGLDTLYRSVQDLNHDFSLAASADAELQLNVNIESLFINEEDSLNLKTENAFHGNEAALPVGIKFANLTAKCFTIEE